MTNDINQQVAEAIGLVTDPECTWNYLYSGPHQDCEDTKACRPFHPSTDLNDAFWAAEKVGHHFYLSRNELSGEMWECSLKSGSVGVMAETPALAICAAILKLKGAE